MNHVFICSKVLRHHFITVNGNTGTFVIEKTPLQQLNPFIQEWNISKPLSQVGESGSHNLEVCCMVNYQLHRSGIANKYGGIMTKSRACTVIQKYLEQCHDNKLIISIEYTKIKECWYCHDDICFNFMPQLRMQRSRTDIHRSRIRRTMSHTMELVFPSIYLSAHLSDL